MYIYIYRVTIIGIYKGSFKGLGLIKAPHLKPQALGIRMTAECGKALKP